MLFTKCVLWIRHHTNPLLLKSFITKKVVIYALFIFLLCMSKLRTRTASLKLTEHRARILTNSVRHHNSAYQFCYVLSLTPSSNLYTESVADITSHTPNSLLILLNSVLWYPNFPPTRKADNIRYLQSCSSCAHKGHNSSQGDWAGVCWESSGKGFLLQQQKTMHSRKYFHFLSHIRVYMFGTAAATL